MADHTALVTLVIDRVAADDVPGVVAALHGLHEAQRRAVWKALKTGDFGTTAAAVAALGAAPGAKSAAEASWVPLLAPEKETLAAQVLTERRPAWLEDLAARLLDRETSPTWGFRVVRALVRDGVMAEPTDPSYVVAMVHGIVPWRPNHDEGATPLSALREDRGLLDRELWELLRTERAGRALAVHDRWRRVPNQIPGHPAPEPQPEATWHHALLSLAGEGLMPRGRLIDAALHAMLADWSAADVAWFVDLHDALAPTDPELAAREPAYLRLLASDVGTVVQVGLRAASRLLTAGGVSRADLATALEPTLLRPQKGTAMAALTLLERLADGEHADRGSLARKARLAVDHPRADVRDRARELAQRWATPDTTEADASPAPAAPVPAAALLVADLEPVTPLENADELAEVLAHLIEEADDPVAVERALDGVLRFAQSKPAASEALARRAGQRIAELYPGPWSGQELRSDLAALVLVWLGRARPGRGYLGRTVGYESTRHSSTSFSSANVRKPDWSLPALVSTRIHEVATNLPGGPKALLSLPTRSDGTLSVAALNERLQARPTAAPLDVELAILRVRPDERTEIRLPRLLRGRAAARQALETLANHTARWERVVGPTTGQWDAGKPITMVGWSDPASPAGAPDRLITAVLDRRAPLARAGLEANDGEYATRPEQLTATWPLMLPHHLDHLAAHAHPRLARALAKNRSGAVPVLDAIGRSPHLGGAPTWSAVALALAAKESPVRTAAIDAFVLRARRALLDSASLGQQIRSCLCDDLVVGARVVESLAEAARADRTSAGAVLDVLQTTLEALPGRRDAYRWIELLADLTTDLDAHAALPQPFSELARGTDRSALARACRRVRAVP